MKQNHSFKITAAGEDFAAVRRAQELAKRLATALEPEISISNDAWKFEVLDNVQVREEAAKNAANADMVIIAASGETEPPTHIKRWIESWLPRKRKSATALVALINHEQEASHESLPLCSYLRRLAVEWGMDFISNSADCWQQCFEARPHWEEIPQPAALK